MAINDTIDALAAQWYEKEFLTGAASSAATDRRAQRACERETELYQKCLEAKLETLGLTHLTGKALAKD